jgi:hypothetical protein
MADDLTHEQLQTMAAAIGLTDLTDEHLEQLSRATRAARGRRASLRTETLVPSDEPGHVFRLGSEVLR